MQTSTFMDGIRSFFITIDGWLYSFIGFLYELITSIATTELIETVAIDEIAAKLYSFIGIFMLFKVSFSLINYIINPDSITDKEKGGTKIIVNIIITFVLIIITPFAFDLLGEAQEALIEDNVIPRIILNTDGEAPSYNEFIISSKCLEMKYDYVIAGGSFDAGGNAKYNAGEYIAMMTIRPFFQIDSAAESSQVQDLFYAYHYCSAADIDSLLTERIVNHPNKSKDIYTVDYTPLIPTIVGVILVLIFVGFVLDIALRTVKLAFLEIIAPIPIMSYIDPSSAKKGLFNKWLKEVGITWADLFLRLAAVYFAIYLISTIKFEGENGFWINLFLILGILMFAKKLPDILKKMLNIDVKGNFKLNPFKRIEEDAIGGKTISNITHGTIGAIGGTIAGARAGHNAGATLRGAIIGAGSGFNVGRTDHKKAFSNSMNKVYKNMSGNDMINLTPSKLLLNFDGKGTRRVKEAKGHLKTAYAKLNELQSELAQISHHNNLAGEVLRTNNIDLKELADEKQKINNRLSNTKNQYQGVKNQLQECNNQLSESERIYAAAKNAAESAIRQAKVKADTAMAEAQQEFDAAQRFLSSYKPIQKYEGEEIVYEHSAEFYKNNSIVNNYNSRIESIKFEHDSAVSEINAKFEEEYDSAEISRLKEKLQEFERRERELKESTENDENLLKAIDSYEQTKEEEANIREKISTKEKEISTIKDESSDREKFYQVDNSTKTSVKEAFDKNPIE